MSSMHKRVGGKEGLWGVGGLYLPLRLFGVQEVTVIGPDKPQEPERHLTNTWVNFILRMLPSSVPHELHCLSCNLTWLAIFATVYG